MRITPSVAAILDRSTVAGRALTLPRDLTLAEYQAANAVLEAAGGRRDRQSGSHLFPGAAREIASRLITGCEAAS